MATRHRSDSRNLGIPCQTFVLEIASQPAFGVAFDALPKTRELGMTPVLGEIYPLAGKGEAHQEALSLVPSSEKAPDPELHDLMSDRSR